MDFVTLEEWLFHKQLIHYIYVSIGALTFLAIISNRKLVRIPQVVTIALALLSIYLIGSFPDMVNSGSDKNYYYREAQNIANGFSTSSNPDVGFVFLTKILLGFPIDCYFYLLAVIYVGGILYFCKSISKENYGLAFIGMLLNFMFVAYGTNTIRAGVASSILLAAIGCRKRNIISIALLLFAMSIHKSWILPASCYLIAKYKDNTKLYIFIWLLSIPVSAVAGESIQVFLSSFIDDARSGYLTTDISETHYKIGFRIDFLLYSCVPIICGYYYIFKRGVKDCFYKNLYNMYILANTFWVLVIKANYSDRFAYLSWFIYSIVLLYPLIERPENIPHAKGLTASIILGLTFFYSYI